MESEELPGNKVDKETLKITEKWFLGDLIKAMMQEIKIIPAGMSYGLMTETQQQTIINRVTEAAQRMTREAIELLAAGGRPHLIAELESVTFKGGVKVVAKVGKSNADRHQLADAAGGSVMIVLPQTEKFMGGEGEKATKDQKELLEGGGDGQT